MKILHITNSLSEGGVESFLLNLLPRLREKGYAVELLVLNRNSVSMKKVFEDNGIKVNIGKYNSLYNPFNVFVLRKYLTYYDIIHVHLWPAQLYISLGKVLSHSHAKFITTEHNNFNKRRNFKAYRFIEQWMYNQFDIIVGVCETSRFNLLKWIRHSQVVAIPNAIQWEVFNKAKPFEKNELGLPHSSFMITMTARFFSQKDQPTLIRALSLLPSDIHVVFVGSGESIFECKALATELGLSERIHFLGRRTDVNRILKTSDLCVLSTHYEGLPISVIEYMSAGKAVVATDVDGIRELISDDCLAKPNSFEDMALKIRRLYEDRQLLNRISEQNLLNSLQYNIEEMVNQYNYIYNKVYNG